MYRCHNGVTDAASPIIIEGYHIANVFIGQFFTEEPDLEFFRQQARKFDFEESDYLKAVSEIAIVERKKLPLILRFLTSFAEIIASLGLEQLRKHEVEGRPRKTRIAETTKLKTPAKPERSQDSCMYPRLANGCSGQ